jgi:hypothetical protein
MSDEDIATLNLMRKEGGEKTAFDLFYEGQLPGSTKNYKELQKDQLAGAKLAGELDSFGIKDTEGEEIPLTAAQLENIELRKLLEGFTNPKELTEDEQLAEIEKNKAMFQKAYGSGRADDASSMLLNFAGKALKPEATVKSAFGEFFEEEGKRPSERKKYKDAATTAAINAYLTGQKTLAETESFMKRTQYQSTEADKLKKAKPEFMEGLTLQAKAEGKSVKNDGVISRQIVSTYGSGKDGGPLPDPYVETICLLITPSFLTLLPSAFACRVRPSINSGLAFLSLSASVD